MAWTRELVAARTGMMATAQTLVVSAIILALNLGTGIITARLLGPQGRGELAAMTMWPQFMAFLLTFGLPSALLYNLRSSPGRGTPLFSAFLLLGSAMGLLSIAVGAAVIPFWLTEYSADVVSFARMGMLVAPVALFTVAFTAVLSARDEFGLYNLVRLLQPLSCLALLLLLAAARAVDPFTAAMATLIAGVPWCLWILVRLIRAYRPRREAMGWACGRLLSYGLRSYGVDLLGTLASQVDRIFVVGLLDPAMMGLYVVAVSISSMLNLLPTAVVSVLFPKSSGRPAEEVIRMTGRAVRVSIAMTLAGAALAAVFSPPLLNLLYGGEFLGAVGVLRILLAEAVLRGAIWILAQAFMGLGRPGLVGVLQGAGLALTIPLMLWLVPRYGLEGAGWALLISTSVRMVLVLASFPLVLKHRPPGIVPQVEDLRDLLVSMQAMER